MDSRRFRSRTLDGSAYALRGGRVARAGNQPVERNAEDAGECDGGAGFNVRTTADLDRPCMPFGETGQTIELSCRYKSKFANPLDAWSNQHVDLCMLVDICCQAS